MRWWQRVTNLFRGKKKKRMVFENGHAKSESSQDGHGTLKRASKSVLKGVTWKGYQADSKPNVSPYFSGSSELVDEVFEAELPEDNGPLPSCRPAKGGQVSCCNMDPSRGKTDGAMQVPSIVIEDSSQQEERWLQRSSDEVPRASSPLLEREENPAVPYEASNSPTERCDSRMIRRIQSRRRRMKSSHITVKYTRVYGESDGAYKNDSTPRGLVFMFNFSKFKNAQYAERLGSEVDYENMYNLFQQMGYDVTHRKGKFCQSGYIRKRDFMESLKAFSQDSRHMKLCSCVVVIMSHGSGPKTIITSDDEQVDLMDVYGIFDNINCQHLQGKPKIFILQFCRNNQPAEPLGDQAKGRSESLPLEDDRLRAIVREEIKRAFRHQERGEQQRRDSNGGVSAENSLIQAIEQRSRNASVASLSSLVEPSAAGEVDEPDCVDYCYDTRILVKPQQEGVQRYSDMYSIFSTSSGELSHRDPRKGSLLIQAICCVFADCAYQDEIDTLVRKVSMYMTKTLQRDDPITVPRQTCERTNNGLDKYFYFNPKEIYYHRNFTI